MASLSGFDASQVPEQESFDAIPAGQYILIATASEMKPTKAGTGEFLQFTLEILDGQYKGRKLWARMNLRNPNQTAVDIAQRELGALCRAVGIIKPNDSSELHNKPFLATVDVEVDDRQRQSNVIKKYEAVGAAGAAAPSPAAAPANTANSTTGGATAPAKAPWIK